MSFINKYFFGEDAQGDWVGVVEGRQDPLQLGRVQVRIYGVHSDILQDIPTEDLPWAQILQGLNGKSFSTPKESEVVYGVWLDGSKQLPLVLGVVPGTETNPPSTGSGFHDLRTQAVIALAPKIPVSRQYNTDGSGIKITEANTSDPNVLESLRHPNANELNQPSISGVGSYQNLANTVIQARKDNLDKNVQSANNFKWSEPYPAYNPEYPYDITTVTESGHVFELDDTPFNERIHIAHRTGSFIEWYPSGSKVEKVTKSNYQIIMSDDYLHVMGKVAITVDGDAFIRVKGDSILETGGKMTANVAGDVDFSVGGSFNVQAANVNMTATQTATIIGQSAYLTGQNSLDLTSQKTTVSSGGDFNLNASGNFNAQGQAVNILASGQAAITASTVGIGGTVIVDNIISGSPPTASGASTATAGQSAGIPAGMAALTKNQGVASPEIVPIPFNMNNLDPTTGVAYVNNLFLVPGSNNTIANNDLVSPDSTDANTANCNFDMSTKTVLGSPSTWSVSENGVALIQSFEGFAKVVGPNQVTAYPNPATGSQPYIIGYGTTGPAINQTISLGEIISRETAQNFLITAINNNFLPTLQQTIKVPITQNMLDACSSLIYHIGGSNWHGSSVLKYINQQQWCQAANAFLLWTKDSGKVQQGVVNRRMKERALFLS